MEPKAKAILIDTRRRMWSSAVFDVYIPTNLTNQEKVQAICESVYSRSKNSEEYKLLIPIKDLAGAVDYANLFKDRKLGHMSIGISKDDHYRLTKK